MVNKTYDNLAEVERQVKLAQRRLKEGKTWHVDAHLERALFHLATHLKQQEELVQAKVDEATTNLTDELSEMETR